MALLLLRPLLLPRDQRRAALRPLGMAGSTANHGYNSYYHSQNDYYDYVLLLLFVIIRIIIIIINIIIEILIIYHSLIAHLIGFY